MAKYIGIGTAEDFEIALFKGTNDAGNIECIVCVSATGVVEKQTLELSNKGTQWNYMTDDPDMASFPIPDFIVEAFEKYEEPVLVPMPVPPPNPVDKTVVDNTILFFRNLFINGGPGPEHKRAFNKLNPGILGKYYPGRHNESKKGSGNNKIMCANYRLDMSADPMMSNLHCDSRSINNDGKFASHAASFVHIHKLSDPDLREKDVEKALAWLRDHAVCVGCFDRTMLPRSCAFNINRINSLCAICKKYCTTVLQGTPCCPECDALVVAKNSEDAVIKALKQLAKIFPNKNFAFKHKEYIKVLIDDIVKRLQPDLVITIRDGMQFLIIPFEQDEDQHEKLSYEAEKVRMLAIATSCIAEIFKSYRGVSMENIRVVMIRFSPYQDKTPNANRSTELHNMYNELNRIVILRQWIIFAITHMDELRHVSMWYLWYNDNKRPNLLFAETRDADDALCMIYHAPKPIHAFCDWQYCFDPYEGDNRAIKKGGEKRYKAIIDQRVSVDKALGNKWRIDKETVAVPKIMNDMLTLQRVYLDNKERYKTVIQDSYESDRKKVKPILDSDDSDNSDDSDSEYENSKKKKRRRVASGASKSRKELRSAGK